MDTFEDPDWGNSTIFSYYKFTGTSDFKVSSSTLESSLESMKKKKKGKKAKRKLTEDANDSHKKNKKQKFGKGREAECAVIPKESEVLSNVSVAEENNVLKKENEANVDKLVKKNSSGNVVNLNSVEDDISVSTTVKKKKNNSNKRNKYKELNIEQKKKKKALLMNGERKGVSESLPVERNVITICRETPANNKVECDKDTSQILQKTNEIPLKAVKLKNSKLEDNKIDGKTWKIKKRKGSVLKTEAEATLHLGVESEKCSIGVTLKKRGKKTSKMQPKHNKDRISNDELINGENVKKTKKKKPNVIKKVRIIDNDNILSGDTDSKDKTDEEVNSRLKDSDKIRKSKKKKSNISMIKRIRNNDNDEIVSGDTDSKDINNDKVARKLKDKDSIKKSKKKNSVVIKNIQNHDNDEIVSGYTNSRDIDDEEVDYKLKDDLEDYLNKLDFSNLTNNAAADDSESLGTIGTDNLEDTRNSDSDDEYIEDEEQEGTSSKQRFVAKREGLGNNKDAKTEELSDESEISPISPQKSNKTLSSIVSAANNKEKTKLNKDILNKMLKESGTPPLDAAEALKEKMTNQLNAARFRLVNEQMYTATSSEAAKLFKADPNSFVAYHTGFKSQVARWPVNPLDKIIKWLKKKPNSLTVADFGCGEAVLAASVPQKKVYSFDLVALNQRVTVCDMAHTPLQSKSVDVAVFCLSLMGTNIKEFILEANRVLKKGGILKIAEVESRISNSDRFIDQIKKYGFNCTYSDVTTKYFYTFDFKKYLDVGKKDIPDIMLKPCKYKKR